MLATCLLGELGRLVVVMEVELELVGNNSRLLLLWCPFLLRVAVFSPVN